MIQVYDVATEKGEEDLEAELKDATAKIETVSSEPKLVKQMHRVISCIVKYYCSEGAQSTDEATESSEEEKETKPQSLSATLKT